MDILLIPNIRWITDSLFNGDDKIITSYLKKYQTTDTCGFIVYADTVLSKGRESIQPKEIGDLNGDGKLERVVALPSFNHCDYGYYYFFSDTTFPRLFPDTYCVNTEMVFLVEDIDQDGIKEVGLYHTTCVSRYKSIRLFRLINNEWEEIGHAVFDILTQDPKEVSLDTLVRKISKNEFEMCNFVDGNIYWETTKIPSKPTKQSK